MDSLVYLSISSAFIPQILKLFYFGKRRKVTDYFRKDFDFRIKNQKTHNLISYSISCSHFPFLGALGLALL